MAKENAWTADEDDRLRELKEAGLTWPMIGCEMNRTLRSVMGRWFRMTHKNAGRREVIVYAGDQRIDVPNEVWEEREARLSAPKTLTGSLMGDPPIGYSALHMRGSYGRAY